MLVIYLQDMDEGESQLMPTSRAPPGSQGSEGVSPPRKVPRGALPRAVARGAAEEKPRKRGTCKTYIYIHFRIFI